MQRLVLLLTLCVNLTACTALQQDRRDAPWDPKRGQTLFDQIPNEDGGANRICCGHLRSCKAYQTPTC
jgi:hypothetical protein